VSGKTANRENLEEQLLRKVSETTAGLTGEDFITQLPKKITGLLGMRYCFIAVCANEDKSLLHTVVFVDGEKLLDNFEYNTNDSACKMVITGNTYFLPKDVHLHFAGAKGIEAYIGVPIISPTTGKILGHIAATDTKPVTEEKNQTDILKIFASRIGAEMERMNIEKELQKKNEELRKRIRENEFYHFTIENLREAVVWVDNEGYIWQVNNKAAELSGYSKEELLKLHVSALNKSYQENAWAERWEKLEHERKVVYESVLEKKDGLTVEVEVTQNYIVFEGKAYTCSIIRDIHKRKLEEELLRTVSENTAAVTGSDYFVELAKFVTYSLNVRFAMVCTWANEEKTKLTMLSYVDRQKTLEGFEYETEGTPCQLVMQGNDFFCSEHLHIKYPREKDVQSWIAVPIYSPVTHQPIGNIGAFDYERMTSDQNQTAILKIFAARAGAEIERINAEKKLNEALQNDNIQLQIKLKESEERFRDLFEEAPIAYVHEGLDSKFIKANRAALRILGVHPDEVPYTYGKTMAPDTPDAQRRMKEAFESVGRGTDTSGVVLELRRRDNGNPIWIQWWSNPDLSGKFTRTMFIDITDKVLMEQEKTRLQAENKYLQEEIKLTYNFDEIVSKSKNFHKILQQIEQVASTDATVLILGESGTGKELMARAVHNISNRSKKPLIKINCAALPANLIESELFGHERGAFTGALERKIGRFELANGGTIFLDEIGELPVELQSKLLRVLQEGEFERLGNPVTQKVNVRVIAATNRNLEQAIEKKEFREDLYYRLNVFPIVCPPLRDRKEDIPLLVKHFCQKYEAKIGKKITDIPSKIMTALCEYDWPGNIRELENIIERALIISRGSTLEIGDWLAKAKKASHKIGNQNLQDVEREHILEILKKTGWKVSGEKGAAKILGLNATTLEARMKKLGIKRELNT
jgi:formate hydrogenlyase transcriptional activator